MDGATLVLDGVGTATTGQPEEEVMIVEIQHERMIEEQRCQVVGILAMSDLLIAPMGTPAMRSQL